ncbi:MULTISPECIES: ABC transporter permease [Microbacterium]|uniref:ABC transporter permease n=1 Tax=Microbacterium profundi TaxID=450380 RepID=A0ABV3LFY8_9MICO|nr:MULTISPECIES: ABC transporter permease [Microbacterium]MCE7482245.1 ABC transporter permease [Microbacterium profundi]
MSAPAPGPIKAAPADFGSTEPTRWNSALQRIATGNGMISVLSVILALVAGSIMIAFTDSEVQRTAGYFFARPGDMLLAVWESISGAYVALFQGAIYNFRVDGFAAGIKPLTETLKFATPLIAAGLGVALAFRAGLFNIGGQGQMLMAAAAAGWVATSMDMPWPLHMLVAIIAGIIAGAIWAGIAGILKARTGAHEVIVTIMLNHIAFYLLAWMLATPGILQAPGSNNPKTAAMAESALLPGILGSQYKLHAGFILALIAVAFTWWLLERSSLGFRFRAVGENPAAARVAGISVGRMYFLVMVIAGGLVGIAGVSQVLGTVTSGFGSDIDAGIGFDAITVALLGRSTPLGVLAAGILFGAFKAGGFAMQASENVPIEIVLVVQSLIVLFIAAPPLVRAIFGLPQPGARKKPAKPKKPKNPKDPATNGSPRTEEVSA